MKTPEEKQAELEEWSAISQAYGEKVARAIDAIAQEAWTEHPPPDPTKFKAALVGMFDALAQRCKRVSNTLLDLGGTNQDALTERFARNLEMADHADAVVACTGRGGSA